MAVITGSSYDDTILGTGSADVVDADAGDDTINGLGGNDALTGGLGSDLIIGGDGDDTVFANTIYSSGKWEDYLVVAVPGGFVLADKRGAYASDEVTGVEFFAFANGTFAADALPNLVEAPVITITAGRPSQLEGTGDATPLTFTVSLDRPAEASLSVLVQGTSIHSYDYDPDRTLFPGDLVGGSYPSERLVFAPGEVSKTVTMQLAGDVAIENDEKLTVYLRDPLGSQAVLGRQSVATMMVLDDDAAEVSISAIDSRNEEGSVGATAFTFDVRLDEPVGTAQTVWVEVAGDGANPASDSDFAHGMFLSGTVTFFPGEVSKTVTVNVWDDYIDEFDEGFRVSLSNPSAKLVVGKDSVATATILNDDMPMVRGTTLDDVFVRTPGRHAYEGLDGCDALDAEDLGYRHAELTPQADGRLLLAYGSDTILSRGIEELRFADGRLVFDAADPAARVARLYEAALDRLPDQDGLNFWIDAVQEGQPLSVLASGFLESSEFRARFGDMADSGAFVDRLYQNVLGRAGEAEGRKFWVDSLTNGSATRADVLVSFSESAENKAGTAMLVHNGIWDRSEAAAEVARLYDTVFGRLADVEGLTFWKNALEGGGATLGQMADAFTGSAEFLAQYGSLGNRQFADALYRNTLDRAPDQAGLDYWAGVLDSGTASRAEVVLAFSESREHVTLTAGNIQSEAPGELGILFA